MRYLIALVITCLSLVAHAAEIVREQGFEIQVQPFPSTFLTQDVASIYGFERSRRQALINVVVLKVQADGQARGALPYLPLSLDSRRTYSAKPKRSAFKRLMKGKTRSTTWHLFACPAKKKFRSCLR